MRALGGVLAVCAAMTALAATGAVAQPVPATTTRVDISSSGGQAALGVASWADIAVAAGGRYVAFTSNSTDLAPGATKPGVYLRDQQTGTTSLVGVSTSGAEGRYASRGPLAVSADGRYVVFSSSFDTGPQCDPDGLYVRDRLLGTTTPVPNSCGPADVAMTPDGRYLAVSIIVDGMAIYRIDLRSGAVKSVAVTAHAAHVAGISDDGQEILFDKNFQVKLWSAATGAVTVVSRPDSGARNNGLNEASALSGDGRYAMFSSSASNLVGKDTNGAQDVFVRDLELGRTYRIDVSSAERQAVGGGRGVGISEHGRYRMFVSKAANLVPGDTNDRTDLFVRDSVTGTTRRVNLSATGGQANGNLFAAAMTANARFIAFVSGATNLVPGDTNGASDVFWRGPLF